LKFYLKYINLEKRLEKISYLYIMTTTIQSDLEDGIVSFAFPKIDTYTNDKGEVKKKTFGMLNWGTINKENCLKYSVGGAYAVVTGEQSNLTTVDFDVKNKYYRLIKKHPELKDYKTIQTNKGFHIWFQYDAEFKTTTDAFSDYKRWIFGTMLRLYFVHQLLTECLMVTWSKMLTQVVILHFLHRI